VLDPQVMVTLTGRPELKPVTGEVPGGCRLRSPSSPRERQAMTGGIT
jgi:hypothetical protein